MAFSHIQHLTRFSCFFDTWPLPTGAILHQHHHHQYCRLLQPLLSLLQIQPSLTHTNKQHFSISTTTNRSITSTPSASMENTFSISDPPTTVADANAFTTTTNTINRGCVPYYTNFQPMNFSSSLTTALPAQTLPQQCFFPAQYVQPPPYLQTPQFPYFYQLNQTGQPFAAYPVYPFWFGQNGDADNNGLIQQTGLTTKEQQRGFMDPQRTKFARIKRKLARQKALSLQRSAASGSSSSAASSIQVDTRRLAHNRDLYNFCTPDNKRLRVLLKKQLKKSDVGSLGRIVLPKREAEENLPGLSDKEGIQIVTRDVYSDQAWTLKFKYWSNNKSRMYVLENTGDFVKQNGVMTGDSLTLYEDESRNFYFSIEKEVKQVAEPSNSRSSNHQTYNCLHTPPLNQARDEEEASLELLIQQLNHREQQEANYDFMTSLMDYAFSHGQPEEANQGPCPSTDNNINHSLGNHPHLVQPASFSNSKRRLVDGHDYQTNNATDDCYGGLDMLPDVNNYNFSL